MNVAGGRRLVTSPDFEDAYPRTEVEPYGVDQSSIASPGT
jgi:hypothetical protein